MVYLHARCAGSDPGLVDERVASTVTEMSHGRINVPPLAVMAVPAWRTHAGAKEVLDLADGAPRDGEEASVGGAIELCLAVIGFGVGASSYFDALENKRVIRHNASPAGGMFVPFGGAKVEVIMSGSRDVLSRKCPANVPCVTKVSLGQKRHKKKRPKRSFESVFSVHIFAERVRIEIPSELIG